MTKPTGRPRGRPRKDRTAPRPNGARGRPRLPLLEDPDRYAVAAVPVISNKYNLNGRWSSRLATKWFPTASKPETIRQKARLAWADRPREKKRNLGKTGLWLRGIATLISVALNYEEIEYYQHVARVMEIAAIRREKVFAKESLLPLIDRLMKNRG